jgi:AbiV
MTSTAGAGEKSAESAQREVPSTGAECLECARAASANAQRLCRAARALERGRHDGPAVSLLASAAEEAAKALALLLAGA